MSTIDRPSTSADAVPSSEPRDPETQANSLSEEKPADRSVPIYGPYYGLVESAFDLTPNPRFLFLSTRQREVLSNLRYSLATSRGLTLLTGGPGTGKTTLMRTALAEASDTPSRHVLVSNPTLSRAEFYEFLARRFEFSNEAARSKAQFLAELQQDVEARHAAGGLSGLIIDEAQSMPHDLLEEIRLLGNIETTKVKLLNIILCGQPELAGRLNEPSLQQLKQRIALRCELQPFTVEETLSYVAGRIRIAGGSPADIFTRQAVMAIHYAAAGIPRTINVLCDNALIGGFAAQVKPIPYKIVEAACKDFDLLPSASAPSKDAMLPAPSERPEHTPALDESDRTPAPPMFGMATQPKRRFSFFS